MDRFGGLVQSVPRNMNRTAPASEKVIERLEIRVQGASTLPALVYLPGLHGDWTLIGSFRRALNQRVRFAEITYPRTLDWSLEDYAAAVESALEDRGITQGWLLGESFSSQVVWTLVSRAKFNARGIILAGGFVRHPARWAVRVAEHVTGNIPLSMLVRIMFGYAKVARFRYRRAPETLAGVREFVARRTDLDRRAALHRLHLIAQNDPRRAAREASLPVFALSGILDPIVPWWLVRRWMRRHCPALREFRILGGADHNVLSTAPDRAAEQVIRWMLQSA